MVVKYRVPVGLPVGGKKYPPRTRLGSGRVWLPPADKKWYPSPYPLGRVPVPELSSLHLVERTPKQNVDHMPLGRLQVPQARSTYDRIAQLITATCHEK
jgi:hypothetical protein